MMSGQRFAFWRRCWQRSQRKRRGRHVTAGGGRAALIFGALTLLLQLSPLSADVAERVSEAQRAAESGDPRAAQRAYMHVLERVGERAPLYAWLAELSVWAGWDAEAQVYLAALADRRGWDTEHLALWRDVLARNGDAEAVRALEFVLAAQSEGDPSALRRLAREQIARQEWGALETTLLRLTARAPNDAEAFYWLGLLFAPNDTARAADYLTQAARDPRWAQAAERVRQALSVYATAPSTDAHTYLGAVLVELGEWAFAERAFSLALEANAVNPHALAYRGYVRDRQGVDGLDDLQAARAMSPNDPLIAYLLGLHWRLAEEEEAARDAFLQAFTLDPTNPALAVEVATSFWQLGELAEAESWFLRALEIAPDDPRWVAALAAFYADTGFRLEAGGRDFVEQAAARFPEDADVQASLGALYLQVGEIARAYEALNRAMSLGGEQPRVRYYFGAVLERRGEAEGAASAYRYVVEQLGAEHGFGLLAARALRRLGVFPSP